MKNVLILAYDFPPYNSIGAQRPYSWYRYFSKSDWYPIVICNASKSHIKDESYPLYNIQSGQVLYVELNQPNYRYLIIRKLHTLLKLIFGFFVKSIDPRVGLYREAHQYLTKNKVDLIIATGEPFILFTYAAQLSKKFNIPWLADYRDGWSTNYTALYKAGIFTKLYYSYLRIIEKHTLKSVSLITTTCNSQKEELIKIHPQTLVEIVLNGFFKEVLQKVHHQQSDKIFTIVYGGTIYPFHKLEVFLSGFKRFIKETEAENIVIKFIGADFFGNQKKRITEYDDQLNKYFEIINRMPLENALEEMSTANVLLLLGDSKIKQLYAKVFDYIALNRKVLFVVSDNSNIFEILKKTNTGLICNNEDDVFYYLKSCYSEFMKNGFVSCQSENLDYYTREYQAQKMISLINSIVK